MNNKKHWFDRLPLIYQELILEHCGMGRIVGSDTLAHAFMWPDKYARLFEAIHCELEDLMYFREDE
jgi:hypothetical protein